MNELSTTTVSVEIAPKNYQGMPVVTLSDIDNAHQRTKGMARKSFNRNKKHFISGQDYFVQNMDEAKEMFGITAPNGLTLLTESGYLMVVKSFDDDLSWQVQRELVNGYFKARDNAIAEKQAESYPLAVQTQSAYCLPPATQNWFYKVNESIKKVLKKYGWTRTELYHKILVECSNKYDLKAAEMQYRKENGFSPEYALDIVEYFPQLQEVAERYLNYLLED